MTSKAQDYKKGSIREMAAIALPMVVSQGCDTVMIFTDRLFLSKLGPEQMNAAMGGGLTVFMMISFLIGIIGYATALVAHYFGAGRRDQCAVVLTQAVILAFIGYIPVLFCRPFAYGLFELMKVAPAQLTPQKMYFDILLYGVIISLLRTSLGAYFSGIGRTGIVMAASVTAMVLNLVLNYLLVFGKFGMPALGIKGAAYGTIIGSLGGLLVLAFAYFNKQNFSEFSLRVSFRFDNEAMRKLLRFGSPTGLELFLNMLAFNAVVLMFHSQGLVTATAATIVFNWDLVSFVPLIGVEIGVISLVGRYMGARDPDTAHRATMSGFKIGLIYSGFILILFVWVPQYLVHLFQPTGTGEVFNAAAPLAVTMIRMAAVYVIVEAMFVVFIGALRGAGDTFWAMIISVSLHWMMVAVLFIMFYILRSSAIVGWAAVVSLFFIFSFIGFSRYRSGQWRKIRIVESEGILLGVDTTHERMEG